MSRVIITAVDTVLRYVEGVKVWLASLAKNAPDESVIVYAQNWDNVDSLKSINPKAQIVQISNDSADPMVRNYIRYNLFLDLLPKYDAVAWIDNDSIVRSKLDTFWLGIEPNSVKYWRRPKRDHLCFQGGVFILGAGARTVWYCQAIIDKLKNISEDDNDRWYAPQLLAYTEIRAAGIESIQLSQKFNDSTFKDDSVIWHCKSSHFNEDKYQKEYKKYLKELL